MDGGQFGPSIDRVDIQPQFLAFIFTILQGGSDKSGIFFFFLSNGTTQLKIIRF
jgi:hypothetical protein